MFPACQPCNNGSASDDALVAFLARCNTALEGGGPEAKEWERYQAALKEHFPGIVNEMIMSANEVRRWMQKRGVARPEGVAYGEVPIIKIPKVIVAAVSRFNEKLLRALHYKHTGKIVPGTAWTFCKWWTNANLMAGEFPRELAEMMPGRASLRRGQVLLTDQFSYAFAVGEEGTLGAYLSAFRTSFAVAAVVVFDPSLMANVDKNAAEAALSGVAKRDTA